MDSRGQESERSGRWRLMPTAGRSWPDTFPMRSDLRTCEQSEGTTSSPLTSSVEDSPAKTSVLQGRRLELTGGDQDYGQKCIESFANFDQSSSLWKTSQICLSGEWAEFSETWPRHGLMRNGRCSPAAPLVLHTCDSVCSSWPTPVAQDVRTLGPKANLLRWFKRSEHGEIQRHVTYTYAAKFGMRPHWKVAAWLMGFPLTWLPGED